MRRTIRTILAAALAVAVVAAGFPAVGATAGTASAGTSRTTSGPTVAGTGSATTTGTGGVATAATQADCEFPVTLTDATGTELTLDAAPERVVTLNPSAAQTMWEIGAREKVVGVSQYATYLEGAGSRTNVSGANGPSVEPVIGLQPDLVLVPNTTHGFAPGRIRQLRDAGVPTYVFPLATSVEDVIEKTRRTGRLVGACEGADATARELERELATVREAVAGEERPRVLYVFFGFTAGEGTFVDELITTAGGRNVAAGANVSGYRRISDETVVEQDPEWIVLNTDDPDGLPPRKAAYNGTTAVREGNVLVSNVNYLNQPAPRVVQPIRAMARAFYPEAYAAANATDTPTPTSTPDLDDEPTVTPTPTPPPAEADDGTDGDDGDDGATSSESTTPGFTLALAVLAVLALALARRRG
jgi:iron complex transport system substrate-binding protein